jgi:MFS family permease
MTTGSAHVRTTIPARAWVVWGAGVAAYYSAVLSRSSLSAVGQDASTRFHVTSSGLSLFAALQLAVYATMQLPVGGLVDRHGPRRLVLTGAVLMATGQLLLAVATSLPLAVTARILVGAGDAMTFVSVLRLVVAWFPPRAVAPMSQLTGMLGGLGQLASVVPLLAVLHASGWTAAFCSVAGIAVLAAVLALTALADGNAAATSQAPRVTPTTLLDMVRGAAADPGIRLGFWLHFSCPFAGTVFALLWGYPFLMSEGLSATAAAGVFTCYVITSAMAGPLAGMLTARFPAHRVTAGLLVVSAQVMGWTVVLMWPAPAPASVLVGLSVVLAIGGPGSLIAFDLARTSSAPAQLGGALGAVNTGGFVSGLLGILLVGGLLDAQGATDPGSASASAYRVAFAGQFVLWTIGLTGILCSRARGRDQRIDTKLKFSREI